ncbi:TPA: hypothetical protein ACH3X1_000135 [Trebouxia sp. C0004]
MADAMIRTSAVSRHARSAHSASRTSSADSSDGQRLRGLHRDPCWRQGTDKSFTKVPRTSQRSACRLAKLHICASRAGYAEPHMSVGRSPMPPPPPQAHQAQPGAVWTALILICATLTAIAGAFTAFVMYMRPVFKRMEQAALATEVASKAMEQSAKEFEQTSLIFQADTPTMIAEIEAAAHEYRELGHTLNVMTAGFRGKNPVKDWSQLSMKRVAKDVSALTHALSPAMEQWRKRISKIAASFEANKAEISTAEKQTKAAIKSLKPEETSGQPIQSRLADSNKDTIESEQTPAGTLQGLEETGQRLANAAVSMRPAGADSKARAKKQPRSADAKGSIAASKSSDAKGAQAGADQINQAADAAEKVTSDVNQLVADLAQGSQDGVAVQEAYEQSAASQDLPGMTKEEQALLAQLRDQKQTAEFVYKALERAEHAATAAATASGALQQAMQEAEAQGVLSSSDTSDAASSRRGNGQDSKSKLKARAGDTKYGGQHPCS